jgi:lipopolysaccharide/colanic/teichoic acid biosynthesis glycosyltransferase
MLKRVFDLTVSSIVFIVCLPVMLIVYIAIRKSMGAGVIFSQARPGLHGKIFKMYKFRTMIPVDTHSIKSDDERITSLGKFLRASSLDELPELINVIKGDMSLVGPRPLLVDYLKKYTPNEMRRHEVLPGITGLAQVRGRNNLSWRHKFKYDVFYVGHQNIFFDTKILIETVLVVLLRRGFRSHGELRRFDELETK